MSQDLNTITEGWDFDPEHESNNVRRIRGEDGRDKIQIRVRGGVIQWEAEGRPDGERPHGFESVLDYCEHLLAEHRALDGSDTGFRLPDDLVSEMRLEIMDYYHRRVMRFQLAEYAGAVADAEHNLRLMAHIRRFVEDREIVMSHEQYRPFVLMDRSRAAAMVRIADGDPAGALRVVEEGMAEIESFYEEYERSDMVGKSEELRVLHQVKERIREEYSLPFSKRELLHGLEHDLRDAVAEEDYERAAEIKKEIARLATEQDGA